MIEVEDIKVINVDGIPYAADDLPADVKKLVVFYNQWRKDEMAAKSELIKVQSAMRDISREIIVNIRDNIKKEEATDESTVTASANDPVAGVETEENIETEG